MRMNLFSLSKSCFLWFALFFVHNFFAQNILVSNANIFEGEPYIAMNPTNPQHLIAAWMGFQFNQKVVIKSAVSFNGGSSWSNHTFQPHEIPGNSSADVSLGFDPQGRAYMCYIDYDNVSWSQGKVVVRKSLDGGITWGNSVEVINVTDCPGKLCIDRPWMVIDPSGNTPQAAIYVTTMNADQPALVSPPYNPYLSVSVDGGQSFLAPRLLDTLNYLAGTTISQPAATPCMDGNGRFYGMYPSYVVVQSAYPRQILAYSDTKGASVDHHTAYQGLNIGVSNSLFKRGGKLAADKAHPGHLAYCFLSGMNDQADIYVMESTDGGIYWSPMQRVNQDPLNNPRVQDLVWADFNLSGDLVVTWRDRRNAPADGYEQPTEIYASVKFYGNVAFTSDYPISSTAAAHDTILETSGNDFMSVVFHGDTCYAVWGDVRSGSLKIYLNKWNVHTQSGSLTLVASDEAVSLYPNPVTDALYLHECTNGTVSVVILNAQGQQVRTQTFSPNSEKPGRISVQELPEGTYFLQYSTVKGSKTLKFVLQR